MAAWPSGKAEVCKTSTPGSNPGVAFNGEPLDSAPRTPFRRRVQHFGAVLAVSALGMFGQTVGVKLG